METNVVVPPEKLNDKCSRYYLLGWLNKMLQVDFNHVSQSSSGATQCQLMDWLFPGSVDLRQVKFQAKHEEEFRHNYNLLIEAFAKKGIDKRVPVGELVKGGFRPNFVFLKWFRQFFTDNVKNMDYDPVKARDGQEICPAPLLLRSPKTSERLDSVMDENQGPPSNFPYTEKWKEVYSWAEPSTRGELYVHCSVCDSDMFTYRKGIPDLTRHFITTKHRTRAKMAEESELRSRTAKPLPCSDAAVQFINKYCSSGPSGGGLVSSDFARYMLGLQYPEDILSICQQTPYCLYMYGGVTLEEAVTVSVVFVGFFDVESSIHRIRLLDVLPSPAEEAGEEAGEEAAKAGEGAAVVETLKRFDLPLMNLSAVYVDGNGASSEQICSQLRELNPNVVAFGALYKVADAACHAAITGLSSPVQDIISDLHAYYTSTSTENECLSALFASVNSPDSTPFRLSTNCLNFSLFVRKLLEMWPDLVSFFSSCDKDNGKVQSICVKLQDANLKPTFRFLALALKPLEAFQMHLQMHDGHARADLVLILQEASRLLHSCASKFLNPQALARFLEERDTGVLADNKFHLSGADLNVGGSAASDLLNESPSAEALIQEVMSFYVTLTGCIAKELPLSDGILRSMAQLLDPQSRLTVTDRAVEELGKKLGVCTAPEEADQLTKEFLEYQQAGEEQGEAGENEDSAAVSLEQHWAGVLKDGSSTSILRKLILSLLSFPCPPLEVQRVYAQAIVSGDAMLFAEDRVALIKKEVVDDAISDGNRGSSRMSSVLRRNKKEDDGCVLAKYLNGTVKPCTVLLTKLSQPMNGDSKDGILSSPVGPIRGGYGWETSLRQKPQSRAVFQAGRGTWAKPVGLDKDNHKGRESDDELGKDSPSRRSTTGNRNLRRVQGYQDGKGFLAGELVWGKLKGFSMWPGMVVPSKTKSTAPGLRYVEWFGDGMFSEIYTEGLSPFRAFTRCFCKNSYASLPTYKDAIYQILELAGERCGKLFTAAAGHKEKELKLMLDWAQGGFLPTGPDGFTIPGNTRADQSMNQSDNAQSDYNPPLKRKHVSKAKANMLIVNYNREAMIQAVEDKRKKIQGTLELLKQFIGENFSETLYRYDEDGYQSYCTVCCAGLEVILCSNASCCRCFCKDCINILVGQGTFDKLRDVDPWSCYMCTPSTCSGNLKLRSDWSLKLQEFFVNNSAMAFEPHRVYPSISADRRRPIKVLSLFDGMATGYLVLKELGVKVERYIASEICT
ncbi:DNA (cytosine-5)-methyltransferase 3A [Merluccius polli]|uniref:DNA (Cytosine-5)-methyltransferase 3A n=1 Tax=Merluccius polli TaxID=89951 RepID=A0AA47NZN4_MERPO|nr:DNA (cytosine-5)-methyltransferase 3A [Merluccius polli]